MNGGYLSLRHVALVGSDQVWRDMVGCGTDGIGSLLSEQLLLSVIGVSTLTDLPLFGVYRDVVDDCRCRDLCCGARRSHTHYARLCKILSCLHRTREEEFPRLLAPRVEVFHVVLG